MTDDTELLRQYTAEHSEAAFSELVRRHVDLVYSVALRKVGGDAHSARDVAQAVFIALARGAASLARRRALAGWLYLTTHHQAAQLVRADRRRLTRETEAHTMNEIFNTPDVDWHQLRPVLDEAMQALSEPDREAVLLRYFERRPFTEIGKALDVTEDAARMRVDRALEKLRTLLARRGVASTAAALATVLGGQVAAAPAGLVTTITGAVVAGAASSAGVAAITIGFLMNTTNLITSTVALAAIGAAVYLSTEASQRGADLAASRQERVALQARLDGVESRFAQTSRRAAALQDQITAMQTVVKTTPAAKETKAGDPAAVTEARPPLDEHERKVLGEVRQMELQRALANYDPLFKKLSLTAAQVDQFTAILSANLSRRADLREFARGEGQPTDPDVRALDAQADADLAGQIRTSFGEATLEAFQHFNDAGSMRELTSRLTGALAASATPLSPAQADQMVEILANNNRTPDGRASNDPRTLNLEAALVQAQAVLSPPQLAALRQVYNDLR